MKLSSVLDEFIFHTPEKVAILAIPAIPESVSSHNSNNSRPCRSVQNEAIAPEVSKSRHCYQFVLRGGEGRGMYRTDTPDLEQARDGLLKRYGRRLLATANVE